jgi:hypothetical protein
VGRLSIRRAASERARCVACPCGSPDKPGGPEWQWFLSPNPHPGLHAPVVVDVDGTVVVVVGAVVVVVDGCVVDVVLLDVVVVVGCVVVVLLDVVVVGMVVDVVVLDVVVVGAVVVVLLDVVVVGAVVVVLLDVVVVGMVVDVVVLDVVVLDVVVLLDVVVVGMVVDVVVLDVVLELDVVVAVVTGIVMIVVVGTVHVTLAWRTLFRVTEVVSDTMLSVTDPDAGATAFTLMSGVVSAAVLAGPGVPGENGPGCPNWIWFAMGSVADSTMLVATPPAGTRLAVPGFTIEPETKFVPLICTVWNRFAYAVMLRPFDCVGRLAVPPGNVTVNV